MCVRRIICVATLLPVFLLAGCDGNGAPLVVSNLAELPTLGEIFDMCQKSNAPDSDGDFLPDDVEVNVLGTNPFDRDTDHDGLPDNFELFGYGLFRADDYPTDEDNDALFNARDNDDNDDLENDGRHIDTDGDGIPNYLEYYGYVYDWMTGMFFSCEDIDCTGLTIYRTDPLQISTDQDAYSDAMEVSQELMDVTVQEPGQHPLVPAYPNLVVELVAYTVTLNEDIEHGRGGSLSKGQEWSEQMERSHSFTTEASWEVGVEVGLEAGTEGVKFTGSVSTSLGMSVSASHTTTRSISKSNSIESEINWSESRSFNPTEAAHMKLMLKMHNYGTAAASDIVATLTLRVAGLNVKTFEPGTQINILVPDASYPEGDTVYWVVDTDSNGNPISLTMNELRALESGAPVSVVLNQVKGEVLLLNDEGSWESVGDCNEFMARCNAACANMVLDMGEGSLLHSMCYAETGPSGPRVTVEDMLALVAEVTEDEDGYRIVYRDKEGLVSDTSLKDWTFVVDRDTWERNGYDPDDLENSLPDDFELGELVLNCDSHIIGKAPRDDTIQPTPDVHFAYINSAARTATVCATDYRGVVEVNVYTTTDGGPDEQRWMMTETNLESGIFVYAFEDDEWTRVQEILDRRADPDPDFDDVLKAEAVAVGGAVGDRAFDVTPPNPRPVPPVIDFVSMDIANGTLYAHVIPDRFYPPHWYDVYPVDWVKAFHPGFPGDVIEMEPPVNSFEDVYGYRCDLPAGWKDTNIRIVAYVAAGVWEERYVTTSDATRAHAQGPMDLQARWLQSVWQEYTLDAVDFDGDPPWKYYRNNLTTVGLGIGGRWKTGWNQIPAVRGMDMFIRKHCSGDLSASVRNWQLYFTVPFAEWEATGAAPDYESIDEAETKRQIEAADPPGPVDYVVGSVVLDPDQVSGKVFLFKTTGGRYGKLEIQEVKIWWDWLHLNQYCKLTFRFVVFATPTARIVIPGWSEGETILLDSSNTEITLDGSTSTGTTYEWDVQPAGTAGLDTVTKNSAVSSMRPTAAGDYTITLTVNPTGIDPPTATRVITVAFPEAKIKVNDTPVADGSSIAVTTALVRLDAGDSVGDKSWAWRLKSKPGSSKIDENTKNSIRTSFDADVDGDYVVELKINPGTADERIATVTVEVDLP